MGGRVGRLSGALLAVVVSGLLVNLLLVVVARSLHPADYAAFSAFWSIALVAGFGAFLPVEQTLARRLPVTADRGAEVRAVARAAAVLIALEVVVLLPGAALLLASIKGSGGLWLVLAVLCLVSGLQFVVRGLLLGTGRVATFSAVLAVDVAIRVAVAVLLSAGGASSAAAYGWAVVAGIGLVHLPVLVLLRRDLKASGRARVATPVRPVLLLLVGSLGAQVLLNGPAVAVPLLADADRLAEVGGFQAAFQLVRIPLFLAVPVQAALVPVIITAIHGMKHARRQQLFRRLLAGAAALAAGGAALGFVAGPLLVRLLFGARYDVSAATVAVLAVGTAAYLSMLVLTQVLVADDRHAAVGIAWGVGVAAGAVVQLTVSPATAGAAASFAAGGVVALAWAFRGVLRTRPA